MMINIFVQRTHSAWGKNPLTMDFFPPEPQFNFTKPHFQHGLHANAFITFSHCVLMYKGKDYSAASKYSVLKGGWAVGSRACATVLCLFLIPWPEAMVCIFRTTAGYLQAGDHSSGFITAHKMTLVSLWSQLCLWCAEKPLHLIATKNCTNVQPDQPHKLPKTWQVSLFMQCSTCSKIFWIEQ